MVDGKGKIVIVTGSTGGIGKEIARGLARWGAQVVIAARNEDKARAVRDELAKDTGNDAISTLVVDVARQSSIRAFAAAFRERHDKLDVLVNNAGTWFSDRRESPDGIELTWATNVLGPYLLTEELAGVLTAASPSRVVNIVSSLASNYDASDVQFAKRSFDGMKVYAASKQALRMLTWWQAKRFAGSGVTANAVAPGFVRTDFNQNARGFVATMIGLSAKLFAVTPEKGARTPIWVASAPELAQASGKYYDGMKEKEGKFHDEAAVEELHAICARMTQAATTTAA